MLFIGLSAVQSFAFEARVLIDEHSVLKTLSGEMRLQCISTKEKKCSSTKTWLLDNGTWDFKRRGLSLKVTDQESNSKLVVSGQQFEMTGSFAMDGQILHRMVLFFAPQKTQWVVHLPVDSYLYGVMGAEVPVSWPQETLKAQAVASRTYFLFKKMNRREEVFDVRSDTLDQVFKLDAKKYRSIIEAVDATHGMILVSKENGQIFPSYFHSDCGGRTSSENKVWRKPSSLNEPVKDKYCQSATINDWKYHIGRHKLLDILQKVFFLPHGVQLKYILPRVHAQSRAHVVDFMFSGNILKRVSANELRRVLGYGKLKSTQFAVHSGWKDIVFQGRGFGHGVGMCQWGAQRWARKGKKFRSILEHYYPKARLLKMDPENYQNLQAHLSF